MTKNPTREQLKSLKPGDKITFRAVTRSGARKATRVVTQNGMLDPAPRIEVTSFHGWANFIVRPDEVLAIEPANSVAQQ